jgi:uncharacterized membrane-anchored protein
MNFLRNSILMAVLVAVIQIGFLGWSIMGRAAILREGREVLLKVEPVDPRDLLRGDYVRLGYEAGTVDRALFVNPPADAYQAMNQAVYVRLAKGSDRYWRPVSASVGEPADTPADGQVDLRGTLSGYETTDAANNRALQVNYGIERYYVPEGEGRAIETNMAIRPFGILAAVDSTGSPQIKALLDGDVRLYEEPLY